MQVRTLHRGSAAVASGLLLATSLAALASSAEAAPGKGITGVVRDAWCLPGETTGELGAAVVLTEKGKRGVTRMRVRWDIADAGTGKLVASHTKQTKRFANTPATHKFRSRHSFDLDAGTYELKVVMTWVRDGKAWRRTMAGICDLRTPDAPPPPPPDLPPDVPPPPTVAGAEPTTRGLSAHATSSRVIGTDGQAQCQSGRVSALAPGVRTDRDEYVWWLSQLWFWDPGTQAWYVDSQSDYAYAAAVNGAVSSSGAITGMPVWRSYPSNQPVSQRTYSGMAPGRYYTAVNWFWTQSGGWAAYYANHGNGTWYCYVG